MDANLAVIRAANGASAPMLAPPSTDSSPETHIVVIPSSEKYADQMEVLDRIGYDIAPDSDEPVTTADMFRNHIRVFPEGQFIALEVETDRVVGLTSSMRVDFDPSKPLLDSWAKTTGYG